MKKVIKKNIFIAIFILILINVTIGLFLLKSRSFSHLAIWNIIESNKQNDFYWQPEDAPEYFHFESNNASLNIFRNEISPLVKDESGELGKAIKVARYIGEIKASRFTLHAPRLQWDSPEGILRQIGEGAGANCFHRAILFSTYLSSLGIKARLWTLENECFNDVAHSINEVYIKSLKKWVFIDVMYGFYAIDYGIPLSFLELRERMLKGDSDNISFHNITNEIKWQETTTERYHKLIKCVFLRADNDFVNKYNSRIRYGIFSIFHKYIDRFPDDIRRGLDYLLGRRDVFVHYVDSYCKSLKPNIIITKLFFYFFILSITTITVALEIVFIIRLSLLISKVKNKSLKKGRI